MPLLTAHYHSLILFRSCTSPEPVGVEDHFAPAGAPADADDPPLVSDLQLLMNGAEPAELSSHFACWVEALARVQIQERGFYM